MLCSKNKKKIAFILAVAMLLSNIPVVGLAQEQTYCGQEHEHVAACYIDPNGSTVEDNAPKTFLEQLLAAQTLQELYEQLTANEAASNALSASQLSLVRQHADTIYAEVQATDTERTYYSLIGERLQELVNQLRKDATNNSTGYSNSTSGTGGSTTDPDDSTTGSDDSLTGPDDSLTDDENGSTVPEKTLKEKLLAAQTLREILDLLTSDETGSQALTEEEVTAVKSHADTLYQAISEPTDDDTACYNQVRAKIEALLEELRKPVNLELTEERAKAPLRGGRYYLTRDLQLSEFAYGQTEDQAYIYIPAGKNVQIDLQGFELSGNGGGSVIFADTDSNVTITDTSDARSGGITGGKTAQNGGAIRSHGVLTINGGSIYGNSAQNGGAIYAKGKVVLNNGYIHSNRATIGGAICATEVEIHGGLVGDTGFSIKWEEKGTTNYPTVYDTAYVLNVTPSARMNTATRGGAIYVKGSFTMDGGQIAGNLSEVQGGAIYCEYSTFAMSGGEIIGNKAKTGNAGAIFFQYTTGTISGGQIRYNRTEKYSGAINANIGTTLTISNTADISYNSCYYNGGAIGIEDKGTGTTTCTITGGTLTYNYATNNGSNAGRGGAIRCVATLYVKGGTISHNKAVNQGGAIHASTDNRNGVRVANVYLQGGTISHNIAASTGGGVCIESETDNTVTFSMTGCTVEDNQSATKGGGIYLAAVKGNLVADLKGGSFVNNSAKSGAGLYVDVMDTAVQGTVNISGTEIVGNKAAVNGGGLYLTAAGEASVALNVSAGKLEGNTAVENGGAAYINAGNFSISGGDVRSNAANANGGGIYVNGGNVVVSGGNVDSNTASVDGGGIAVNNGEVVMTGGSVSGNRASSGSGGGVFVSSTGEEPVSVKIFSGSLNGNNAARVGGAVGVSGENGEVTVQIGVNENHYSGGAVVHNFTHDVDGVVYTSTSCPEIKNNSSGSSGGAFHIKGARTAQLKLYCLIDGNNRTSGDTNPLNEHMSDFMMVEGGTVYISTGKDYSSPISPEDDHVSGFMTIHDSIHVVGGVLELFGSKDNPSLKDSLTIDLRNMGDKYVDHRASEDILTISYHENFFQPDGTPNSTQTAFDIESGGHHTINGGLYAHEGYQLYGWNTDKEANAVGTQTGWYNADDDYQFIKASAEHAENSRDEEKHIHYGNLTLYAIWKVNGYYVDFVPGVPENETWSGETWTEVYTYNEDKALPENRFVWPGYAFNGWKLPDDSIKAPGEEVKNLTTVNAATVTVTAQWIKCDHPTCEVTSDGQNTLTKTCTVCRYSATAKLTAENAVYDNERHEATLEYSDEEFWKDENGELLTVKYVGYTIQPQNVVGTWTPVKIGESRLCIGAGEYTASITSGGVALEVEYTIEKAEQKAPVSRPTYIQPGENSNVLKVVQIPSNERISTQSEAHVQYIVRYVESSVQKDGEVVIPEGTDPDQLDFTLPEALKVYSVLAYYPETDDYLASNMVSAELSFLFTGNLQLKVDAEEGIDFWLGDVGEEGKKELILFAKVQEDEYYVIGEDLEFEKSVTAPENSEYSKDNLVISPAQEDIENGYTMTVAPAPTEPTEITIYIHGVKKKATVTGYAKEKQHFSNFANDESPKISRDSAFTVRFDFENFDTEDYLEPELKFYKQGLLGETAKTLPAGTTIILRDLGNGSYWYTKIGTETDTVKLGSFKQMTPAGGSYQMRSGDLKLQFVVDFSRAAGNKGENLICAMSVTNKEESPNAAALERSLSIDLAGAALSLGAVSGHGTLTNEIKFTAGSSGAASKYDHRDMALVVTPKAGTVLPVDASIRMNLNGEYTTWRPDSDGKFYISLGNYRPLNTEIALELNSSMFPQEKTSYYLDAALYLSTTDAEEAPLMEGHINMVDLHFRSNLEKTGIKIAVQGGKRLFTTSDSISAVVTVEPKIYESLYNVVVELRQEFNGNTFGNITIKPQYDEATNTYTFPLSSRATGDYCVVASLQTLNGYVINEAKYYFIIHPTENEGN